MSKTTSNNAAKKATTSTKAVSKESKSNIASKYEAKPEAKKSADTVTISFEIPKSILNHLDLSQKEFTRIFRMFGAYGLYSLDYLEDDDASLLTSSPKDFTDHLYSWLGDICEKTSEKYALLHDILEEEVNEEVADKFEDDMEDVWEEDIDNILSDDSASYTEDHDF